MKLLIKTIIFTGLFLFIEACEPEKADTTLAPDASVSPTELLDETKGFHKIYRYFDNEHPIGADILGLDMTVQSPSKLNIAFGLVNSTTAGNVKRVSIDYLSKKIIKPMEEISIPTFTNYFYNRNAWICQFAPFSDKVVAAQFNAVSTGSYFNLYGDQVGGTGLVKYLANSGRFSKSQNFITSSSYNWSGLDAQGSLYGYIENNKYKGFVDIAGFKNVDYFNTLFEPFTGTMESALIAFNADSVTAYTRDLNDTLNYHAKRTSAVLIGASSPDYYSLAVKFSKTIIKNNENNHDFSFAYFGPNNMDNKIVFWTYKYNYLTKTITKVLENAEIHSSLVALQKIAFDIDSEGNLYYVANDEESQSIYKITTNGTTKIYNKILLSGKVSLLKYFNGKIFLIIANKNNNRQLDIFVQD